MLCFDGDKKIPQIFDFCRANQEWQWRNTLFTIAK